MLNNILTQQSSLLTRVHGWNKEVHDRDELKKFLVMIITLQWVWSNYPHVEDFWATYWPYATPTFSKVSWYYTVHVYVYMLMYLHVHVIIITSIIKYQNMYTLVIHIYTLAIILTTKELFEAPYLCIHKSSRSHLTHEFIQGYYGITNSSGWGSLAHYLEGFTFEWNEKLDHK